MTVAVQTPFNSYTGDAIVTVFAYTYRILDEDDLVVKVNGALQTIITHYTVSGVGDAGGGNVTFLTAPGDQLAVTILRAGLQVRDTDYTAGAAIPSTTLDTDIDKVLILLQDLTYAVAAIEARVTALEP